MLSCALCWIFQESSDVSPYNMNKTFPPKYEFSFLFSKKQTNKIIGEQKYQSWKPIHLFEKQSLASYSITQLSAQFWITQLQNSHHKKHLIQRYAMVWIQFELKTTKIVFHSFLKQNSNKRYKFQKRSTRNFLIFQPITAQQYQF